MCLFVHTKIDFSDEKTLCYLLSITCEIAITKPPVLRYDTIGRIELIPSIVLSSDNTNYKNIIQLFLQLFDELSVYRDYH